MILSYFLYLAAKTEVRNQKSEIRSQKTEVRRRKSEIRNRKSEVGSQKTEVGSRAILRIANANFDWIYNKLNETEFRSTLFTQALNQTRWINKRNTGLKPRC